MMRARKARFVSVSEIGMCGLDWLTSIHWQWYFVSTPENLIVSEQSRSYRFSVSCLPTIQELAPKALASRRPAFFPCNSPDPSAYRMRRRAPATRELPGGDSRCGPLHLFGEQIEKIKESKERARKHQKRCDFALLGENRRALNLTPGGQRCRQAQSARR